MLLLRIIMDSGPSRMTSELCTRHSGEDSGRPIQTAGCVPTQVQSSKTSPLTGHKSRPTDDWRLTMLTKLTRKTKISGTLIAEDPKWSRVPGSASRVDRALLISQSVVSMVSFVSPVRSPNGAVQNSPGWSEAEPRVQRHRETPSPERAVRSTS